MSRFYLYPRGHRRVPHIWLVFCKLWDSAGLPLKPIAGAPVRTSVARIFYPQGPQIEEANPLSEKSLSARNLEWGAVRVPPFSLRCS